MLDLMLRYGRTLGLSMVMVMLMVAGCADFDNPLAPTGDEQAMQRSATENVDGSGILTKGNPHAVTSDTDGMTGGGDGFAKGGGKNNRISQTKKISATRGGQLHVKSGTGTFDYYLYVPPGALSKSTEMTIEVNSESEAVVDLYPEGLQFNIPVTLTMIIKSDLKKAAIKGQTGIYYYNPVKDKWEFQHGMTYAIEDDKIVADAQLDHFSRWALGGDSPSSFLIQKYWYENYQYSY